MATVNTTTSTTSTTSRSPASLSSASAAEQQDRFMKLLVAQMKNQDPLNPMDNAQMTSQIAQINTVGGIEKLNTTVESLLASFSKLQAQSSTHLAGRDVLVAGNQLTLDGGAGSGGVSLAAAADSVNVEILDAGGQPIRSIALGASGAGVRSFNWDGLRSDGQPAGDGSWRMRVTATAGGKPVPAQTLTAAHVQSVSEGAAGVELDLGSAGLQPLSAVKSYL